MACPPIIAPCFYGIDMSTIGELFAPQFLQGRPLTDEIEAAHGRRSSAPIRSAICRSKPIARAIGFAADQLCQACITGEYPTPCGQQLYQIALEKARKHEDEDCELRTYEESPAGRE